MPQTPIDDEDNEAFERLKQTLADQSFLICHQAVFMVARVNGQICVGMEIHGKRANQEEDHAATFVFSPAEFLNFASDVTGTSLGLNNAMVIDAQEKIAQGFGGWSETPESEA